MRPDTLSHRRPVNVMDSDPMFDSIVAAEQQLILVRETATTFRIIAPRPDWFLDVAAQVEDADRIELSEVFPFLESFQEQAEAVWSAASDASAESDIWVENTQGDSSVHLRALALNADGHEILAIQPMEKVFQRMQELMQRGRSELRRHSRKEMETNYKETMLNCLIHDLVGSLSVAEVVFRKMQEREDLSHEEREALSVGRNSMHSVSSQLRSMVDILSAEMQALDHYETDRDLAPDILDCTTMELVNSRPAFRNKDVKVTTEMPEDPSLRCAVVGVEDQLQRIIFNLLENALRYSSRGKKIRVCVSSNETTARFSVEDEGPGVPPELGDQVFERFAKDRRGGGKSGLGLFFAKTMIERWGGKIGHEKPETGGARFWFELPLALDDEG